jgi:hypothetical protein
MRVSEVANVRAKDFNWEEGTVVILGKGNRYRKALAGNGVVKAWFAKHHELGLNTNGIQTMLVRLGKTTGIKCNAHAFRRGFCIHQVKSGLSNKVIQSLGGWETPDGICLDAEGAIWVASPRTSEVIRVQEGGEVTRRIKLSTEAFAYMLGGPDRKTLFIMTATTFNPEEAQKKKSGKIEIIEVDVPGAGLP